MSPPGVPVAVFGVVTMVTDIVSKNPPDRTTSKYTAPLFSSTPILLFLKAIILDRGH